MKLVLAKKENGLKGAFLVSADDPAALRKLKGKKVFYPFVADSGHFGQVGAVFSKPPLDASDSAKFQDQADQLFKIVTDIPEDESHSLARETLKLKGNRIDPTTFTISKVSDVDIGGEQGKLIEGKFDNAYDPRLPYLDPSESTEFGEGKFNPSQVYGVYDGTYMYIHLSPYADQLSEIASKQEKMFEQFSQDPTDQLKSDLNKTARLLKPHAHEIYKIVGDKVYFINKYGRWQMNVFTGMRPIDLDDRMRLTNHLKKIGLTDAASVRSYKEKMYQVPILDRIAIDDLAPIFLPHLGNVFDADQKEFANRVSSINKLKPTDTFDGLPGLRDHVELFPHQNYVLSHIKDRARMLADVDPGGGKTLIMVCDILYQLQKNPGTRPLIIMPESLLSQVATEIKHFSELNPWIINTESIKKWKDGTFETFMKDAKAAPPNTVFLSSYNWISKEINQVPNGQLIKKADPETGEEKLDYKKVRVFPRVDSMLDFLGINAVYRDEAHLMRNESNVSRAASSLARVPIVRDMTGTIMPGNLMDVTGAMGSLHSGVFGTPKNFLSSYSPNNTPNRYHPEAPKEIRKALRNFGVPQVRKSAWASLLPKVEEFYHFVKFTPAQQKVYESLLNNTLDEIEKDPILSKQLHKFEKELSNGEPISSAMVLARFVPLDVFLNAPREAKSWIKGILSGDDAISPKAKMVSKIAKEHLSKPDAGKVLVFVQFKESAKNLLENLDPDLKSMADYYEGGMIDVLNRFKNPDSNLKILIGVDATLRAGHNLQVADCLVDADLLWTPGEMDQRKARSVRLKQAKPVELHHIVIDNSAEMLKLARLISSEHMIAKANSDFEDKTVLPQIEMTLKGMKSFRKQDELEAFLDRKAAIEVQTDELAEKDREKFGIRPIKPRRVDPISTSLPDAKELEKVPSSKGFKGDSRDIENLVDKELNDLPLDPANPHFLKLNLQQWDDDWYVTVFRAADMQGYVRKFGFKLQRNFYFMEVPSRGGATQLLQKIEDEGIHITNKHDLENNLHSIHRLLKAGQRGIVRKMTQQARQAVVNASFLEKVEAAKKKEEPHLEAQFHFATIDGYPVVFTDTVLEGSPEAKIIKKIGFKLQQPFWYIPVTRSRMTLILNRFLAHKELRIADWEEFARDVHKVFLGINMDEFSGLAKGVGNVIQK